jgi:hypothetical protein
MADEAAFVATATRIEVQYRAHEYEGTKVTTKVVAVRSRHDDARGALSAWARSNVALDEDGVTWQLAVTELVTGAPVDVTHYELVPTVALVHNRATGPPGS